MQKIYFGFGEGRGGQLSTFVPELFSIGTLNGYGPNLSQVRTIKLPEKFFNSLLQWSLRNRCRVCPSIGFTPAPLPG